MAMNNLSVILISLYSLAKVVSVHNKVYIMLQLLINIRYYIFQS